MSLRATIGKRLPLILGILIVFLAIGFGFFVKDLVGEKPVEQKKVVQQITLIAPPPPPPSPPEPEPEPEVEEPIEEPVDEAMPEEPMDNSPATELGMDADGAAGGDGFGLIARKGGSGLLGGGSPYAADVQAAITDMLSANEELRHSGYQAIVRLWIDNSGRITRYEVQQREGSPRTRELLLTALASAPPLSEPPPIEMPQPIKLRIKSQL